MLPAKRFALLSFAALSACDASPDASMVDSKPTCENIREQVVEISKDRDVQILKIYDPELVSEEPDVLSCKGSAFISTSDERQPIFYKMQTDEEGDSFIGYSGDPYPTD